MRRVVYVLVVLVFSVSAFGVSREDRGPRERNPVVKAVKKLVKSLGDGLTLPTPAPTPGPKP